MLKSELQSKHMEMTKETRKVTGAFYTPKEYADIIYSQVVEQVGGEDNLKDYIVWDCACGSGNLLVNFMGKVKYVYGSSLQEDEVRHAEEQLSELGVNFDVFQLDYLQRPDSIFEFSFTEQLPFGLQQAIYNNEKIVLVQNPPYGRDLSSNCELESYLRGIGAKGFCNDLLALFNWQTLNLIESYGLSNTIMVQLAVTSMLQYNTWSSTIDKFLSTMTMVRGVLVPGNRFIGLEEVSWFTYVITWVYGVGSEKELEYRLGYYDGKKGVDLELKGDVVYKFDEFGYDSAFKKLISKKGLSKEYCLTSALQPRYDSKGNKQFVEVCDSDVVYGYIANAGSLRNLTYVCGLSTHPVYGNGEDNITLDDDNFWEGVSLACLGVLGSEKVRYLSLAPNQYFDVDTRLFDEFSYNSLVYILSCDVSSFLGSLVIDDEVLKRNSMFMLSDDEVHLHSSMNKAGLYKDVEYKNEIAKRMQNNYLRKAISSGVLLPSVLELYEYTKKLIIKGIENREDTGSVFENTVDLGIRYVLKIEGLISADERQEYLRLRNIARDELQLLGSEYIKGIKGFNVIER